MIYQWKSGARIGIDAQIAGEELERIRIRNNGRLESEMVIEAARDEQNPLHSEFQWNDAAAANAYRIEQARYLIRSIEAVVDHNESKPIRAFVSVVRDEDRSYTSVSHAMADPELRRQVLLGALRELEAWRDRYAELVELANVFVAIDEARAAK
ncbi:hypothetical protein SZ64_04375 [Erythrobacter sp. SG61-1L]|uniref:hypothetical protein n=1 Tax=Erythrobacter sp. SG61-1L TaxID=1603897 RepID=UPI0006C8E700|nr:hypothetical protein [Erythrobacter sp. SG61-1L]KPL67406.1 hypothetical protein SZ64_04375 [Erythrobacter sp. SG61-1L]